jgi:hypothetical protein
LIDPVKLYLLNQRSLIPTDTLRSMANELLPGARRQRIIQIVSIALSIGVVGGGTVVYFRYFSTWTGFDPVNVTIYVIQIAVILAGPFIGIRVTRSRYVSRVARVLLEHHCCPHCGYDIRDLPADASDGATVCPECGCAWRQQEW